MKPAKPKRLGKHQNIGKDPKEPFFGKGDAGCLARKDHHGTPILAAACSTWNAQATLDSGSSSFLGSPQSTVQTRPGQRGIVPSDHPLPAKPIPPLARGTAAPPGNSWRLRAPGAGRAGPSSSGAGWVPRGLGVQQRVALPWVPLALEWVTSCHPRRDSETRRCRVTDPRDIFTAGWKIPPWVFFFSWLVGFFFLFFLVLANSTGWKEGWERQEL